MIITIKINLSSVFGLSILNLRSIPAGHSGYLVSVNYLYRLERDIYYMDLKVKKQTRSGLNTEFVNTDTGRRVTLEQAIRQIEKGNPNYSGYQSVQMKSGTKYIRSRADHSTRNNIEEVN